MCLDPPHPADARPLDLHGNRLLIFIVAYEAQKFEKILRRIRASLHPEDIEILIIDNFSAGDENLWAEIESEIKVSILRTSEDQGYGGSQKLAFRYAIDNAFDYVALIHGDGQYALEKLPTMLQHLVDDKADAVFGSRMIQHGNPSDARMATRRRIGNGILTWFENIMLQTNFSEFHYGYRVYSTAALNRIPFERNTSSFHFDTEVTVQFALRSLRVIEVPVPPYFGGEICYLGELKYAWDILKTMFRARFHQMNLLFDRRFDVHPPQQNYDLKIGFLSSHTAAIDAARPGSHILDVGCGQGYVARELAAKGCWVTGMDQYISNAFNSGERVDYIAWNLDRKEFPVNVSHFDQIFMLDIIEHLKEPETFMDELRFAAACKRPEIVITTANIGFVVTRLMLLFGQFNYGRKGILDATHTRLFTFRSLRDLLDQSGYTILEERGIPAPFPKAIGNNWGAWLLLRANQILIRISKRLFSYQIFVRAEAKPTVNNLLAETINMNRQGVEFPPKIIR